MTTSADPPTRRSPLVEYGDYRVPALRARAADRQRRAGALRPTARFVFRHFPLIQVHPNAESAAESAEFAGAHGRFWEMHDAIYDNQDRLGLPLLFVLARKLGLSELELQSALESGQYEPKVRADFLGGVRSGVNGTPSFFINGERHDGTYAFDDLVAAIELRLRHHVVL